MLWDDFGINQSPKEDKRGGNCSSTAKNCYISDNHKRGVEDKIIVHTIILYYGMSLQLEIFPVLLGQSH